MSTMQRIVGLVLTILSILTGALCVYVAVLNWNTHPVLAIINLVCAVAMVFQTRSILQILRRG